MVGLFFIEISKGGMFEEGVEGSGCYDGVMGMLVIEVRYLEECFMLYSMSFVVNVWFLV